jgi:hypothetical protein
MCDYSSLRRSACTLKGVVLLDLIVSPTFFQDRDDELESNSVTFTIITFTCHL